MIFGLAQLTSNPPCRSHTLLNTLLAPEQLILTVKRIEHASHLSWISQCVFVGLNMGVQYRGT